MRHLSFILRLGLLLWMSGWYSLPAQQKESELTVIEYRDGRLRGRLPYGEVFELRGPTLAAGAAQPATVVQVQIFEETQVKQRRRQERRARRRGTPVVVTYDTLRAFYTGTWWARPEEDGSSFSVFVDQPLQLDTRYKFRINFFQRYTLDDAVTQRLVEEVKRDLFDELENRDRQSIRVAEVNAALQARVAAFADSIRFGYLHVGENGRMRLADEPARPPGIAVAGDFTEDLQGDLARLIREERSLRKDRETLAGLRVRMRAESEQPAFEGLLVTLENIILTDSTGRLTLRPGDIRAIRGLFARGSLPETDPFRPLIDWLMVGNNAQRLRPDQIVLLQNLQTAYQEYVQYTRAVAVGLANIDRYNARIGAGGLDQLIAEGFILSNSAEAVSGPYISPATVSDDSPAEAALRSPGANTAASTGFDAISVGTAYGVSVVGLNFGQPAAGQTGFSLENTEPDMITYIGIKIYFSKIDKALKVADPYPLFRDRFSLLAGVKVTGDLNYKGRDLGNVIGVQPVVGLSLDLNRAVSLDGGLVFFDETALSPLRPVSRLRTAPFIGLSVDANAFNAFRNLINGLK